MADPFDLAALGRSYCAEAVELAAQLQDHILALERGANRAEHVHAAFRLAHNLKGSGGSYGLPAISRICQPLEDCLELLRRGDAAVPPATIELLLRYADVLAAAARAGAAGMDMTEFAQQAETLAAAGAPAAAPAPAAIAPVPDAVIVVADHAKVQRRIVVNLLRDCHCQVHDTDDGIAALELLHRHAARALITGLELKGISGHALTAAVKTDPVMRAVKVVYLTSRPQARREAVCPPDAVIAKDAQLSRVLPETLRQLQLLPSA
ncbi:MAG TPA: Hpt domain-containing protein [bacterium]|nr:Hpt domain-containing protein [bacterium]